MKFQVLVSLLFSLTACGAQTKTSWGEYTYGASCGGYGCRAVLTIKSRSGIEDWYIAFHDWKIDYLHQLSPWAQACNYLAWC